RAGVSRAHPLAPTIIQGGAVCALSLGIKNGGQGGIGSLCSPHLARLRSVSNFVLIPSTIFYEVRGRGCA
ncbi:MAG: hypothetical protein ACK529_01830, partial [Alphaproteobacteria bacterium]